MGQTAHGVVAQEVDLPDLLTHYILNEMAGAEHRGRDWIDFMTKGLRDGPHSPAKTLSEGGKALGVVWNALHLLQPGGRLGVAGAR